MIGVSVGRDSYSPVLLVVPAGRVVADSWVGALVPRAVRDPTAVLRLRMAIANQDALVAAAGHAADLSEANARSAPPSAFNA